MPEPPLHRCRVEGCLCWILGVLGSPGTIPPPATGWCWGERLSFPIPGRELQYVACQRHFTMDFYKDQFII